MTVSVAIATYNRARMVAEAIEAALAQSRAPDEIVVADDASTDGTAARVEEIAARDSRVRLYRRPVNSGGVDNWNFAMREARGDFIAWCSDDDRFLRDHLEASLAYLETHPEIGLVHSGFIDAVEGQSGPERIPRCLRSTGPLLVTQANLFTYLIRYYDWPFHPSTLVMRREVWERTGEFDPVYALADTDWFVRAVETFPAAMLPRHGVLNRRHAGNWSNRLGSARMQREIFEIVERAIERRWPDRRFLMTLLSSGWKAVWRFNVRLRLLWTLHLRLASGHGNAACAAWRGLLRDTGHTAPVWLQRAGEAAIRRWCAGRTPVFEDARHSVSPL